MIDSERRFLQYTISPWLLPGILMLIGLAMFPYGWLAELWPRFGHIFDHLFASELSHIIGHLVIFGGLGMAVLLIFPQLRKRPWLYLGLILGLGMVQEFMQLASFKHRLFSGPELFDLGVDLFGAGLAWLVVSRHFSVSNKQFSVSGDE